MDQSDLTTILQFLDKLKIDESLTLAKLYGNESIKARELSNSAMSLAIAAQTDIRVAAKVGACNFFSTYLPMAIGLGVGATFAQIGVNAANNYNGRR